MELDPNTTPALAPPEGVVPNFVDPYSQQPQRIVTSAVCLTLCTVAVILRFWSRILVNKFNWDDGVLFLALGGFATLSALIIVAGEHGDGRHQWNVTLAALETTLYLENIAEMLYCITMFSVKYVVLRQIETIFFNYHRKALAYKIIWGLIWANLAFYIGILFSFIFACTPREKIWKPLIEGHCINQPAGMIAGSAINMLSDFIILITPIAAIWRLQMPLNKKIGAGAVFAVGIFACCASIMRLYYAIELFTTDDMMWAIAPVGQWTTAEFTTVILVACFPNLPQLYKHYFTTPTQVSYNSSYIGTPYSSQKKASRIRANSTWASLSERQLSELSDDDLMMVEQPAGVKHIGMAA